MSNQVLDVKLIVKSLRDASGNFVQATPKLYTVGGVKQLAMACLDNAPIKQIPTVKLSRDGSTCEYSITELQQHNDHMPTFTDEGDLYVYCDRVLAHIVDSLRLLNWRLSMIDDLQDNFTIGFEQLGSNCCKCNDIITEVNHTNKTGLPLCATCCTTNHSNLKTMQKEDCNE